MTTPDPYCLFTGRIEERDDDYVVTVPASELDLGALSEGEVYRVGVYPAAEGSAERQPSTETVERPPERTPTRRAVQTDDGPPVEEGEVRELAVEDVGDQGDGLARVGPGYVVFVPDARVGDEPTVRITTVRENFAFAEKVE
jgi:predicted RNA-binding protein with TRAM domain